MQVKSLFDKDVFDETISRVNQLNGNSLALWGKMNVAQMLAHCKVAFGVPLSDKPMPRMFLGLLMGWMMKKKLYNNEPWKHNLPTAPNFIIKDERNFAEEKSELISLVTEFNSRGPKNIGKFPHPFFGTYTKEQWGLSMWKHLDHHLKQFGV